MKQATKRFVSFVGAVALVVGALVVYFNFIRPIYRDVQDAKAALVARQSVVAEQERAIGQVQKLLAEYGEGSEIQRAISQALPFDAEVAGALLQVHGILANNNLTLQSIGFSLTGLRSVSQGARSGTALRSREGREPSGLVKPIGRIKVQATFSGTYEDFKAFTRDLESNIRIFDVESMQFAPRIERRAQRGRIPAATSTPAAAGSTEEEEILLGASTSTDAGLAALEALAHELTVPEGAQAASFSFNVSLVTYYQTL
jgi:Tfp pilus assembly protein PilO